MADVYTFGDKGGISPMGILQLLMQREQMGNINKYRQDELGLQKENLALRKQEMQDVQETRQIRQDQEARHQTFLKQLQIESDSVPTDPHGNVDISDAWLAEYRATKKSNYPENMQKLIEWDDKIFNTQVKVDPNAAAIGQAKRRGQVDFEADPFKRQFSEKPVDTGVGGVQDLPVDITSGKVAEFAKPAEVTPEKFKGYAMQLAEQAATGTPAERALSAVQSVEAADAKGKVQEPAKPSFAQQAYLDEQSRSVGWPNFDAVPEKEKGKIRTAAVKALQADTQVDVDLRSAMTRAQTQLASQNFQLNPEKLKLSMQDNYTQVSKDDVTRASAYANLLTAANAPENKFNNITLVYNFSKLQDPNTVKEGEYELVSNAGRSLPTWVMELWIKAKNGESFTPQRRAELIDMARKNFEGAVEPRLRGINKQFSDLMAGAGINPIGVIRDVDSLVPSSLRKRTGVSMESDAMSKLADTLRLELQERRKKKNARP